MGDVLKIVGWMFGLIAIYLFIYYGEKTKQVADAGFSGITNLVKA